MESISQNRDHWREAILKERENGKIHPYMLFGLKHVKNTAESNALVLGDASLIQCRYLLEISHFNHVTDVDLSPTLLDDGVLSQLTESKITRTVSRFDTYDFPLQAFDFIYGKSIAFNPKETLGTLLSKISDSLTDHGIFCAVYGLESDSFRPKQYTREEILNLYNKNKLEILEAEVEGPVPIPGLINPGTRHQITIVARKKSNFSEL